MMMIPMTTLEVQSGIRGVGGSKKLGKILLLQRNSLLGFVSLFLLIFA